MSTEQERRQLVLAAAERLLRKYGPGKTTIAEIAKEAQISVGAVYLEFDSKEQIIEALSTLRHTTVLRKMRAVAERDNVEYADKIQAIMNARLEAFLHLGKEGDHASDLFHCASSAVQTAHERFLQEEKMLISGVLREGTMVGELFVQDPDLTAVLLIKANVSFTPPWIYKYPPEQTTHLCKQLNEMCVRGLLRRARKT